MIRILLTIFMIVNLQSTTFGKDKLTRYTDLVKRNGLFYKKFSNQPFSGEVEGFRIHNLEGVSSTSNFFSKGKIEKGVTNGLWEYYFNNGNLHTRGKYKNGRRIGKWEFYKNDGKFLGYGIFDYDGEIINGIDVLVNNTKKGDLLELKSYSNRKLEGLQEYYYEHSGKLRLRVHVKNGLNHGPFKEYYFMGDFLKSTGFYKNGELNGLVTDYWNKKGSLKKFYSRFDNGNLVWRKFYNKDGLLQRTESYGYKVSKSNYTITYCFYKIENNKSIVDICLLRERYNDNIITQPLDVLDSLK